VTVISGRSPPSPRSGSVVHQTTKKPPTEPLTHTAILPAEWALYLIIKDEQSGRRKRGRKYNFFDFPFLWKLFKVSFTTVFIYVFATASSFVALYDFNLRGLWLVYSGCSVVWPGILFWLGHGTLVLALMRNLTVGQNIILAAPSHIRHWITSGRALDAHRRALLDLQMSTGANVMNPRRHWREKRMKRAQWESRKTH